MGKGGKGKGSGLGKSGKKSSGSFNGAKNQAKIDRGSVNRSQKDRNDESVPKNDISLVQKVTPVNAPRKNRRQQDRASETPPVNSNDASHPPGPARHSPKPANPPQNPNPKKPQTSNFKATRLLSNPSPLALPP